MKGHSILSGMQQYSLQYMCQQYMNKTFSGFSEETPDSFFYAFSLAGAMFQQLMGVQYKN